MVEEGVVLTISRRGWGDERRGYTVTTLLVAKDVSISHAFVGSTYSSPKLATLMVR